MAGRNPNSRSRDMIISMAVILVPILLIAWFFTSTPDDGPEPVDVEAVLTRAKAESPYPLLVPQGLTDEWVPVRAAWAQTGQPWITTEPAEGNSWQVGYLSPADMYFGVQQRDAAPDSLIRSATRDGRALDASVEIGAREWQRYESEDGRTRSLVQIDGETSAVVTADVDFSELEAFAATLVEVQPST